MNIEVGSKWAKDGEVVEVFKITTVVTHDEVIFYTCKKGINHVLFDYDFLEQYKPYEPVYEYQYAYEFMPPTDMRITPEYFINDKEFFKERVINVGKYQRLDFTKRERT